MPIRYFLDIHFLCIGLILLHEVYHIYAIVANTEVYQKVILGHTAEEEAQVQRNWFEKIGLVAGVVYIPWLFYMVFKAEFYEPLVVILIITVVSLSAPAKDTFGVRLWHLLDAAICIACLMLFGYVHYLDKYSTYLDQEISRLKSQQQELRKDLDKNTTLYQPVHHVHATQ